MPLGFGAQCQGRGEQQREDHNKADLQGIPFGDKEQHRGRSKQKPNSYKDED